MSRTPIQPLSSLTLLLSLTGTAAYADYTITSTFDGGIGAWSAVNDVTLSWSSAGGVSGGYLVGVDKGTGEWWYYGAPAKFLGTKSAAYGKSLSLWLMQSDATPTAAPTIANVIIASDSTTLVYKFATEPGSDWTQYSVPVVETAGWRKDTVDGAVPTEAEFRAVLANLTRLQIRGEYSDTRETGGLDDVVLTLSGDRPVPVLPVASTFDATSEGWRALGNTTGTDQGLTWLAVGGNPDGCIRASDLTSDTWYFVAPEAYLGDLGATYGTQIRFDLRQASTTSQFDGPDVLLQGESITLVHDTAFNPGTDWTRFSVPLLSEAWRVGSLTGAAPTEAELRGVLAAVAGFQIRGEYRSGDDTAWLDNVIFGTGLSVYGDSDGSGTVNLLDVAAMVRLAAGLQTAASITTLDVAPRPSAQPAGYGDGALTLLDALRVLRYLRGLETIWP
jgi:hypothetical protein